MNKIIYIYERKKYFLEDFFELGFTEEFIDQLSKQNFSYKNSDRSLALNFVGVISFKDITVAVLPKYINTNSDPNEQESKMIQIIKVLKKYANSNTYELEDAFYLTHNVEDNLISDLTLADYIIADYLQYGIYNTEYSRTVLNGESEINWQKTIDELNPFIIKDRPYYLNTYSSITQNSSYNYIAKVHQWAIQISIENYGTLLGYKDLNLDLDSISDITKLGTEKFILSLISKELMNIYDNRKINLLKALYTLLKRNYSSNTKQFSIYGSQAFHYVWEAACSTVLQNQYTTFKKYIPKPTWINLNGNDTLLRTIRPDILRALNTKGNNYFFIFDAKYYKTKFTDTGIENNPGVEDVSKQHLYEKVFNKKMNNSKMYNTFLMPLELCNNGLYEIFGCVKLDIIEAEPIILLYLSPNEIFRMYTSSEYIKNQDLISLAQKIDIYIAKLKKDKKI